MIIAKNIVSSEELSTVLTPEPTESFTPISHSYLVEQTREAITRAGYSVKEEKHALARFGQRYFGGFAIVGPDLQSGERQLVVGLRNAHDKTFAASMCIGNRMMVCENLCFSSDIKLQRRHTTNILRDIPRVLSEGVSRVSAHWVDMESRMLRYQQSEVTPEQVAGLAVRLAEAKALPGRDVFPVVQEWKTPRHPEFATPTLWSLYNAVTEHLKGGDLNKLPARTMVMQSLFDGWCGHHPSIVPTIDVDALSLN